MSIYEKYYIITQEKKQHTTEKQKIAQSRNLA
jgi:hypothetical protein